MEYLSTKKDCGVKESPKGNKKKITWTNWKAGTE